MDILQQVRTALETNKGRLRDVATETGLSYDTVLRIKNGEGDPGFSKVEVLHRYFSKRVGRRAVSA